MDIALDSTFSRLTWSIHNIFTVRTDLPFCPTRDKPPGKRRNKFLATLYDKKRYVIHYRNLQQCTRYRKDLPRTAILAITVILHLYRVQHEF